MSYYNGVDINQIKVFNMSYYRWYIYVEYVTKKDSKLCDSFDLNYEWYRDLMQSLGGFIANNDGEIYFKTKELAEFAKEELVAVLYKLKNRSKVSGIKNHINNGESNVKFNVTVLPTTNKNNKGKFVLTCMEFEVRDYYWGEIIGLNTDVFRNILIENYNAVKTKEDVYWNSREEAEQAKKWLEGQIVAGRLSGSKECRYFG